MSKINLKHSLKHLSAIIIFVLISVVYFSPVLEGKKIFQNDKVQYKGMSKEIFDHRSQYNEDPLWTNSMFGGMPAYQISAESEGNLIKKFYRVFQLYLPHPIGLLFLYLFGFYFLLVSLKIDYRLAIVGAISFGFSSYFFIILEAGHNTKAHTIGYMAPLLASVLMVYRGKLLVGTALTALVTALMINANHLQITYYLILLLLVIGIVFLVKSIREKKLPLFLKQSFFLILAGFLGAITCSSKVLSTLEYGEESIRGQSELTSNNEVKTSGLDKDYATAWSYGVLESFTLLIPNFHGGASNGELGKESNTYELVKNNPQANQIIKKLPLYWGSQPFTSGPVYAGSICCFLFVLGFFLVNTTTRIWVAIVFLLMLFLSWGKNFMPLTDFFLDYIPGYNKFRAVSTTLVIVELLIPFLGILALSKVIEDGKTNKILNSLYYSFGITAGLCLLFAVFSTSFFDFKSANDSSYGEQLSNALVLDRGVIFQSDAIRSLIFIVLTFIAIWLFLLKKIKPFPLYLIIGTLIIVDMWGINNRYLNKENFTEKRKIDQPFTPSYADQQIFLDKDPNFRVFNTTVSTFNDASTSYFHKSIGGYHGAKLRRYQELIDFYISKGNMNILNMLNTKYFIVKSDKGPIAQQNKNALGNSWFVSEIIKVANSDKEIELLGQINVRNQAVVDDRFITPEKIAFDSSSSISLTSYKANHIIYEASASENQFAVFSEIYYNKGWNAYIDGKLVNHVRANYLLRGLEVPFGTHKIEFKFEPSTYYIGEKVSLASSGLLILLLIFVGYKEISQLYKEE